MTDRDTQPSAAADGSTVGSIGGSIDHSAPTWCSAKKASYSCILTNARILKNKLPEHHHLLYARRPYLLFVPESWLNNTVTGGMLDPQNQYCVFIRCDRPEYRSTNRRWRLCICVTRYQMHQISIFKLLGLFGLSHAERLCNLSLQILEHVRCLITDLTTLFSILYMASHHSVLMIFFSFTSVPSECSYSFRLFVPHVKK